MERLYDCINIGDVEMFFLLINEISDYVFLVTEKIYNNLGNSQTSKRIGIAMIRCHHGLDFPDIIKYGATIHLV
jgi:hypothetical protein